MALSWCLERYTLVAICRLVVALSWHLKKCTSVTHELVDKLTSLQKYLFLHLLLSFHLHSHSAQFPAKLLPSFAFIYYSSCLPSTRKLGVTNPHAQNNGTTSNKRSFDYIKHKVKL